MFGAWHTGSPTVLSSEPVKKPYPPAGLCCCLNSFQEVQPKESLPITAICSKFLTVSVVLRGCIALSNRNDHPDDRSKAAAKITTIVL